MWAGSSSLEAKSQHGGNCKLLVPYLKHAYEYFIMQHIKQVQIFLVSYIFFRTGPSWAVTAKLGLSICPGCLNRLFACRHHASTSIRTIKIYRSSGDS
jgi:hypothetical protein